MCVCALLFYATRILMVAIPIFGRITIIADGLINASEVRSFVLLDKYGTMSGVLMPNQ